jgi:hypothetical protein
VNFGAHVRPPPDVADALPIARASRASSARLGAESLIVARMVLMERR